MLQKYVFNVNVFFLNDAFDLLMRFAMRFGSTIHFFGSDRFFELLKLEVTRLCVWYDWFRGRREDGTG